MGVRNRQGSFYTPLDIAERLAESALREVVAAMETPDDCPRVLDPTCGTGNFLLVAALLISDRLVQLGGNQSDSLSHVVTNCLFGTDIDAAAIDVCRANLATLTTGADHGRSVARHILPIDSLRLLLTCGGGAGQGSLFDEPEASWSSLFPEVFSIQDPGFDVVVGNPPFLNQLGSETALPADLANSLVDRFGDTVSRLTNTASIFILGASELVNGGGVISLIQPVSFLATRESKGIRQRLLQRHSLKEVWFSGPGVFDAAVEVVAVTMAPKGNPARTRVLLGREFTDAGLVESPTTTDKTWSRLLARAKGFPQCTPITGGVVGDIATGSADFRDQYYGLVGAVRDQAVNESQPALPRLATVGLIDLARFMWGERATKFAKDRFVRPVVDVERLGEDVRRWVGARSQPKVIVSNQTKNLEVYVDVKGDILPSVPLLTIDCELESLWLVAASIAAPVVTAVAAERHLGAGMSVDVLKLSVRDVLNLPTPHHTDAWARGAAIFKQLQESVDPQARRRLLSDFASEMNAAFGVQDSALTDWWLKRLPTR